jgi:ABC-type spermidine/putrescine transport system permease subunit I
VAEIGVLALRAVAAGALVVIFALIGEVVTPKAFSGLFSAAPSVAVASLAITIVAQNSGKARQASTGMVVGAVAMVVCCVLAVVVVPRIGSLWASLTAWVGWAAIDLSLYWAVFIGAH